MERLNNDTFDAKVLHNDKLVLVDFYSDSCMPCKRLSPVLAELEETYSDKLFIGKVNIAYESDLIAKYEVQAAPTLVFFKNGNIVERKVGFVKKADLIEIINANI